MHLSWKHNMLLLNNCFNFWREFLRTKVLIKEVKQAQVEHQLKEPQKREGILVMAILELKDLNPQCKSLDCVQLPIVEVLLLVVEDDTLLSSYSFLIDAFKSCITDLWLVYFGVTGDGQNKVKISLVRCGKGSTQVDASQNVARTAIKTLKPKAVFSVGCCGGLNRAKAELGDVVISAKRSTFCDKKVIHHQRQWDGRTLDSSRKFGFLIKSAADGWKAPLKNPDARNVIVHRDAEILSGVEVVNSFEESLFQRSQICHFLSAFFSSLLLSYSSQSKS